MRGFGGGRKTPIKLHSTVSFSEVSSTNFGAKVTAHSHNRHSARIARNEAPQPPALSVCSNRAGPCSVRAGGSSRARSQWTV